MENIVPISSDENAVPGVENRVSGKGRLSNRTRKAGVKGLGGLRSVDGNVGRGGGKKGLGGVRAGGRRALGDITNAGNVGNVEKGGVKGMKGRGKGKGKGRDVLDGSRVIERGGILGNITIEELMSDPRIPRDADGNVEDIEYMPKNYEVKEEDPVLEFDQEELEFMRRRDKEKKEQMEKNVEVLLREDGEEVKMLQREDVGGVPVGVRGVEDDLLEEFDGFQGVEAHDDDFLDQLGFSVEELGLKSLKI